MTRNGDAMMRPAVLRFLVAIFGLALLSGSVFAGDLSEADAINVAGRQRMLSQRIIKAYCQIGLGLEPAESRRQMEEAITRFEASLGDLKAFAADGPARVALQRVATLWLPFRSVAAGPVTREGARRLLEQDDALLLAAHQVVLELAETGRTPRGRLVNMSGRQRMLSQRLAKFYMLRAWQIDSPAIEGDMQTASSEFAGALAELAAAPETTPEIGDRLRAVAVQWEWFQQALTLQGGRGYERLVAAASESILTEMDAVTVLYAALP